MNGKKRKIPPSWLTEAGAEEVVEPQSSAQDAVAPIVQPVNKDITIQDEDEEDDYLAMTFDDPGPNKHSLMSAYERKALQKRERGKTKSKSDVAAEAAAREAALQKSLLDDNNGHPPSKAMKMMQRMGYTSGRALGADGRGIVEPLRPVEQAARSGLGLENQRKRDLLEQVESVKRQVHEEQTDYRDAVRSDIDEKRTEGRIYAAQKICETLDTTAVEEAALARGEKIPETDLFPDPMRVNVLWRSRVIYRKQKERERALKQQMLDCSMTFSGRKFNDDEPSMGMAEAASNLRRFAYEEDCEDDEDDQELRDFDNHDPQERLDMIIAYLKQQYYYCFWCGCKYADKEDLENCPGESEHDHE